MEAGGNQIAMSRGKIPTVTSSDIERDLDNPIWACLATRHAHIASGGPLVRRYPPVFSPIAGFASANPTRVAAIEALVEVGDDMGSFGPNVPSLSANWVSIRESVLEQMVRSDELLLQEGDVDAVTLGTADIGEMLALVELTQPGPFRQRTIELGTYVGIREGGRLVAMAGQRMWVGDYREVSAVCTHPDAQGRGYARALMGRVINGILRAGERPFLHVDRVNLRAIDTYRALGFVRRTELPLLHARRIG